MFYCTYHWEKAPNGVLGCDDHVITLCKDRSSSHKDPVTFFTDMFTSSNPHGWFLLWMGMNEPLASVPVPIQSDPRVESGAMDCAASRLRGARAGRRPEVEHIQ